jgi:hypothetical protein
MPRDHIKEASRRADQEFFEKGRKLSPVFPPYDYDATRRVRAREEFVARAFLTVIFAAIITAFFQPWFGMVAGGVGFAGLTVTCYVASSREHDRQARRRSF